MSAQPLIFGQRGVDHVQVVGAAWCMPDICLRHHVCRSFQILASDESPRPAGKLGEDPQPKELFSLMAAFIASRRTGALCRGHCNSSIDCSACNTESTRETVFGPVADGLLEAALASRWPLLALLAACSSARLADAEQCLAVWLLSLLPPSERPTSGDSHWFYTSLE